VNALVYSSSLAAAFLGGIVALFAPCCVVSLLPMFVGAALRRGRVQLPVTAALFAAGVAAVLLPVVLGVGALGQVFAAHHRAVFLLVGLFLTLLGALTLTGYRWFLPVPMLAIRTGDGAGGGSVFLLGIASGVSSSCCAPVLAGVVAMSALAASAAGALGLGLAYVFGMVFPLFLAALFWDRLRFGERLTLGYGKRLRVGRRSIPWTDVAAGAMFVAVGLIALGLAVTDRSTYMPDALAGWNRWATGAAGDLAAALRRVPTFTQALALAALAAGLGAAACSVSKRDR
jgi:cytochrome c-type biogenesis protein